MLNQLMVIGLISGTIILSIIHIAIWNTLPRGLRDLLFASPFAAFLADVLASEIIVQFAGASWFIGICNLSAAVIFGIYVMCYCKYYKIKGIEWKWFKLWIIPIFPYLAAKKIRS